MTFDPKQYLRNRQNAASVSMGDPEAYLKRLQNKPSEFATKNEMPEFVKETDRAIAENLANGPNDKLKFYQKEYPSKEFKLHGNQVLGRSAGEPWGAITPEFRRDNILSSLGHGVTDNVANIVAGPIQAAATSAGAAAGGVATLPSGGWGALPAGMAASGTTAAVINQLKQRLGQAAGIPQEVNYGDTAREFGIGLALPAITGTGNIGKSFLAKGLGEDALHTLSNQQRGLVGRTTDFIGRKFSTVPDHIIENYQKYGKEALSYDQKNGGAGVLNYLDPYSDKAVKAVNDNHKVIGKQIEDAYGRVQKIDMKAAKQAFLDAVDNIKPEASTGKFTELQAAQRAKLMEQYNKIVGLQKEYETKTAYNTTASNVAPEMQNKTSYSVTQQAQPYGVENKPISSSNGQWLPFEQQNNQTTNVTARALNTDQTVPSFSVKNNGVETVEKYNPLTMTMETVEVPKVTSQSAGQVKSQNINPMTLASDVPEQKMVYSSNSTNNVGPKTQEYNPLTGTYTPVEQGYKQTSNLSNISAPKTHEFNPLTSTYSPVEQKYKTTVTQNNYQAPLSEIDPLTLSPKAIEQRMNYSSTPTQVRQQVTHQTNPLTMGQEAVQTELPDIMGGGDSFRLAKEIQDMTMYGKNNDPTYADFIGSKPATDFYNNIKAQLKAQAPEAPAAQYQHSIDMKGLVDKYASDPKKLFGALGNLDARGKIDAKEQLVPYLKSLGVDLEKPEQVTSILKYFGNPSSFPMGGDGVTSTTKSNTASGLVGNAAAALTSAVAPSYSAIKTAQAFGSALGAHGSSPKFTKWALDNLVSPQKAPTWLNQNAVNPTLIDILNQKFRPDDSKP